MRGATLLMIVGLGLGLGLLAAPTPAADPAASAGELSRLREENAQLRRRVQELEGEVSRLSGRASEAEAKARKADESSSALTKALERRGEESVSVSVDEGAGGVAVVSTDPSRLERAVDSGPRHWLTLRAKREPGGNPPKDVSLVIATAASPGLYRGVQQLALSVDGTSVDCPVVNYAASPVTGSRSAQVGAEETVTAAVPMATLDRLANASEVRGTLGRTSFRLTPEQLAAIRAFRQKL